MKGLLELLPILRKQSVASLQARLLCSLGLTGANGLFQVRRCRVANAVPETQKWAQVGRKDRRLETSQL